MAEAQLDFGEMEVEQDGMFKAVKVLLMTFPFSNAGFAVALPAENGECLFEGMKMIFKQIGGVPLRIRIDNMSTAVVKAKTKFEDERLTDAFIQFANHYRFEVQVCNPRSGHEKGNVENKVGYVRYNFFGTAPQLSSYKALNELLHMQLMEDLERPHYEKGTTMLDLWYSEKAFLYPLPDADYPVFKEILLKANKYNEVIIDKTKIHVLGAKNHVHLTVILTWEKYQIVGVDDDVLTEGFRPYMFKGKPIPWQDIISQWRKKLNVMTYSRYFKYLPEVVAIYLKVNDRTLQWERLKLMSQLLQTHDMTYISSHFYELIGADSDTSQYDINWQIYDQLVTPTTEVLV